MHGITSKFQKDPSITFRVIAWTPRQTNRQTNKVSQKHYLLGGGNNTKFIWTQCSHIHTSLISVMDIEVYMVAKNCTIFVRFMTLPNINRFLKFFHCQNVETICNNTVTIDLTTRKVCHYTIL